MTAITKVTRGMDGMETTLTYKLPPQTTPFAPPRAQGDHATGMPPSCSLSVFCRSLSYYVYSIDTATHDPHPLRGQHCLAVQALGISSSGAPVGYDETCWPENYFALFDNEWGELNGAPRSGPEGSASTAAFPGGGCLAGWTTACTTTVTAGGDAGSPQELYPQAWCCPPGQWTCATATGLDDREAPQRLCRSYVTGRASTEIWMSWDPAYFTYTLDGSTSSMFEAYTWKASVAGEPDPAHAATVYRKVFPLVLSSGSGSKENQVAATAVGTETDPAVVVITVTEAVTVTSTEAVGMLQGRAMQESGPKSAREPGALLLPDTDILASRCTVAGLLGAAFATAVMSLLALAMLYRGRRRDRRRREVVATAAAANGKAMPFEDDGGHEVGIMFQT